MNKVESHILKKRIISANRRRKRAEKNLKRVRKESTASINHWRKATVEWQKIAYEYAKKYEATLNVNKDKDMEEILRIHSRFFALEMQRTIAATIPTRNTDPNIMYNGKGPHDTEILEEMHSAIINKVCEYLRNHIDPKLIIYHNDTWCSLDEFIDKMKKAMEL